VNITLPLFIGSLALAVLLGMLLGYLLAGNKRDSRKDKARITELETSLQEYQEQVQQHFSTTAGLFQDLGQNYRNLYHYMAESAGQLCPKIPETAALQFAATGLLPDEEPTVETAAGSETPNIDDTQTNQPEPESSSATETVDTNKDHSKVTGESGEWSAATTPNDVATAAEIVTAEVTDATEEIVTKESARQESSEEKPPKS